MTSAPFLQLQDLTRSVRLPDGSELHILRGVTFDVHAGDHIAIVGRSGSGKTTLLNQLGLIDRQTSGELLFDGLDVRRLSDRRRARLRGAGIGFVFQQFNLLDGRSALENVMMPLLYGTAAQFRNRRRAAMEMLERVGLSARADQTPNRLSGGEQQRVAVARALVRRPRLILADEPTGALDVTTGEAVMSLLDEIARESEAALVTITHDLQVAALSDRAYLLDTGVLTPLEETDQARGALAATAGIRAGRARVAEVGQGVRHRAQEASHAPQPGHHGQHGPHGQEPPTEVIA